MTTSPTSWNLNLDAKIDRLLKGSNAFLFLREEFT